MLQHYESAFRVRGVNLSGMPPIGNVYMPLDPGLTVLYGKNGVGKSRILSGLQQAFTARSVVDGVRRLYFEAPEIAVGFGDFRLRDDFPGHPWLWVGNQAGMTRHPKDWTDYQTEQLLDELVEDGPRRVLALRLILEQAEKTNLAVNDTDVEALCEVANNAGFAVVTSRLGRSGAVSCTPTEDTPVLRELHQEFIDRLRARLEAEPALRDDLVRTVVSSTDEWPSLHAFRDDSLIQEDMRSAALIALGEEPPPPWAADHYLDFGGRALPAWGPAVLTEEEVDLDRGALVAVAAARNLRQPIDPGVRQYLGLPLWYRLPDAAFPPNVFRPGDVFSDDGLSLATDVVDLLAELSAIANEYAARLLDSPPHIECNFRPRDQWALRGLISWHAIDRSGARLKLTELSRAHQRWTTFAAKLAMLRLQEARPAVVVLDEPEQALHRQAERRLALAMKSLADELEVPVVVATHSPAFLEDRSARLVHVQRDDQGMTTLRPVPDGLREDIASLGLDVADVLQFCKVIVLVEGQHELVILDELFGEEFKVAGVEVFSTRGARHLKSAADAALLWRYTDAHVMVLVDNEDDEAAAAIWMQARAASSKDEQLRALSEFKIGGKAEGKFLHEFCSAVLDQGQAHRVSVHGLALPDIIEYLPVGAIAPKRASMTWASLRDEYVAREGDQQKNFKDWMRAHHGADYADSNIVAAVRSMDAIPQDLARFAMQALAVGAGVRRLSTFLRQVCSGISESWVSPRAC